ncbi:MAG: hypothetical protein OEV42_16320 [Deltaproteobacteria bacterium]|nr:hypothetical protein [Deltaproteobacteria bacterium]
MKKSAIAAIIAALLLAGNSSVVKSEGKKSASLSRAGDITLMKIGKKPTIGVNQFIGKWLASDTGSTVTIKPGGRWKSVSPDGEYHMSGKWKIVKGALFWKYHGYHDRVEEINIIESISKDRFVIRKPDGSLVEFKRIKD